MREKDVEGYLCQRIRDLGGLCLKWTSPGLRGVPDRIVLLPAMEVTVPGWPAGYAKRQPPRVLFVELKASGRKLSRGQSVLHNKFEELGHDVFVIDSPEVVDIFIERECHA